MDAGTVEGQRCVLSPDPKLDPLYNWMASAILGWPWGTTPSPFLPHFWLRWAWWAWVPWPGTCELQFLPFETTMKAKSVSGSLGLQAVGLALRGVSQSGVRIPGAHGCTRGWH